MPAKLVQPNTTDTDEPTRFSKDWDDPADPSVCHGIYVDQKNSEYGVSYAQVYIIILDEANNIFFDITFNCRPEVTVQNIGWSLSNKDLDGAQNYIKTIAPPKGVRISYNGEPIQSFE